MANKLNEREFLELIEKYRDEFYRFIHRSVWNPSEVDDVFSEAILVAWQRRDSFQPGTNFRAWFYKILLNKSFVANRHTKRHCVDYDSIASIRMEDGENTEPSQAFRKPENYLDQVDDDLLGALNSLRGPERACILLRAFENSSYKEIADVLEIPVGTVMTHLARGRARFRTYLREAGKEKRETLQLAEALMAASA